MTDIKEHYRKLDEQMQELLMAFFHIYIYIYIYIYILLSSKHILKSIFPLKKTIASIQVTFIAAKGDQIWNHCAAIVALAPAASTLPILP
jgi:hypothetical protein